MLAHFIVRVAAYSVLALICVSTIVMFVPFSNGRVR